MKRNILATGLFALSLLVACQNKELPENDSSENAIGQTKYIGIFTKKSTREYVFIKEKNVDGKILLCVLASPKNPGTVEMAKLAAEPVSSHYFDYEELKDKLTEIYRGNSTKLRLTTGAINAERANVQDQRPLRVTEGDDHEDTIPSIKTAIKLITEFETSHPCTK
jgi:hypothetical protein